MRRTMQLYALLEENAKTQLPDQKITGLTDDSRKVKPGMLFACIRGEHFDGHTVAAKMLEQGAAAVIADHDLGLGERQILTADTRALYGRLWAPWFGTRNGRCISSVSPAPTEKQRLPI